MQRAAHTPKRSDIHHSLDYPFTEETFRDSLADFSGARELRIGFANFIGRTFSDLPRPDVTYYFVLTLFRVPARERIITFDQHRIEPGITALIYPVHRVRRASIRKRIFEDVLPACSDWLELMQRSPRTRKPENFCVYYDQTFDELVHRTNHALK